MDRIEQGANSFTVHGPGTAQMAYAAAPQASQTPPAADAKSGAEGIEVSIGRHVAVLNIEALPDALERVGTPFALSEGRLRLRDPRLDRALQALVAAYASNQSARFPQRRAALSIPGEHADEHIEIELYTPVARRRAAASGPRIALRLRHVCAVGPEPVTALQRHLGITPAEAACALKFTEGRSIDQVAARLGISRNTVRAHLRSLYAKTGTNHQTALVALVHRSLGEGCVSR